MRSRVALLAALVAGGCGSPRPSGPVPLLGGLSQDSPARGTLAVVGGQRRRALVESTRFAVRLPRRAVVSLGLGLERDEGAPEVQRGFVRLAITADGRLVGERRLNPRATGGWRSLSVPFQGSGRPGSLELQLGFVNGQGQPLPLPTGVRPAVADPVLHDRNAPPARRGIVFVSIDTLRRDHTSLYGYPRATTPRLDAWARRGLVFDDAVSVTSWTLPAHFSMMTGVDPAAHGATHTRLGYNRQVPTLAALLRARGFSTHAITSAAYVSPLYGLDDGFDDMDYRHNRRGFTVAQRAIAFLDQVAERPFFLFLHFYDPHWPYDPPPALLRLYADGYAGKLLGKSRPLEGLTRQETSAADLAYIHALYDGEIRYVDEQVARVFQQLSARGLEESTLALVTSDHGEEFLDHGGWAHGRSLYEELIRLPLVLRGPGVPSGKREAAQVSLIDLAPTVLDWAGLPPLAAHQGRSLLGRIGEREAYGETNGPQGTRLLFARAGEARWKLVHTFHPDTGTTTDEQWFDLARDPREMRNRAPSEAVASSIRGRLLARWREAGRGKQGQSVTLSAEEIEKLRAVGYVQP